MAVALTSTVNLIFGSQVLDSETGILFNDEVSFVVRDSPYVQMLIKVYYRWMTFRPLARQTHLVSGRPLVGISIL